MDMYCMYDSALLDRLQQSIIGIKVTDHRINCAAFADDVTLVAACKHDLQLLFDIAYQYSLKLRFKFNPKKCGVLIFGRGNLSNTIIKLGGHTVTVSKV